MHHGTILAEILSADEMEIRKQGLELLQCLDDEVRWSVAERFMRPENTNWELAAWAILPESLVTPRVRHFATACALYKLEQERRAGREPPGWAWQAVEWSAWRADGGAVPRNRLSPHRTFFDYLFDAFTLDFSYHTLRECVGECLGEGGVDVEQIPEHWRRSQPYVDSQSTFALTRCVGEVCDVNAIVLHDYSVESSVMRGLDQARRRAVDEEADQRHHAVCLAAAACFSEGNRSLWSDVQYPWLPPAETLEEWRWQRQAWQRIVAEGRECASLIFGV